MVYGCYQEQGPGYQGEGTKERKDELFQQKLGSANSRREEGTRKIAELISIG